MKLLEVLKRKHIIAVSILFLGFVSLHIVQAATAADPSQDITVASQDYVDAKISELNTKIEQLTQQLQEQSKYNAYQVVELTAGQKLVAGASSEIIVRAGTATAISGVNGDSLADMTTDDSKTTNLINGQTVPVNHLLIVSRDDGRGVKAISSKVYILFKGTYTIN